MMMMICIVPHIQHKVEGAERFTIKSNILTRMNRERERETDRQTETERDREREKDDEDNKTTTKTETGG